MKFKLYDMAKVTKALDKEDEQWLGRIVRVVLVGAPNPDPSSQGVVVWHFETDQQRLFNENQLELIDTE